MHDEMLFDLLYYMMLGAFMTHELDAARRREWRILPVLKNIPETTSETLFIWLHIPLFVLILWGDDGEPINSVRLGLAAFAVIHVGLHWMLRNDPACEFNNTSSWSLILLTGGLGGANLAAALS